MAANPLTLILPLAAGTDLQKVAAALAGNQEKIDNALTSVGTVHFARFVLFDSSTENLQPDLSRGTTGDHFKLAVITAYDGNFNAYIQDFVNEVGDIFDLLLSFTSDGQHCIPVAKNDASQPPNNGLYAAYPQSVQQILAAFS